VLARAGGMVVGLRVFVGPATDSGITDLGTVSTQQAAAYLMQLAATAEGAVARDALMPAMIADSVDNTAGLAALARDRSRSRDTRRSAISWLSRAPGNDGSALQVLLAIAGDDHDNRSVRQAALSTLARLDGGAGIPSLTHLAADSENGWLSRTALSALAQSGDPRVRDYLRRLVSDARLPDEVLAVAIRGLGQEYATAADIAVIRGAWSKLIGERSQSAAMSAAAEFGGTENVEWLLSLARDMNTTWFVRRRALEATTTAGARTSDLTAIYDRTTDPDTKAALISALGQIGDQAAMDRLLTIARSDDSPAARKRAISVLGRSGDPRARAALEAIVERQR
jgi:HEAT repeat protein